MAENGIIKITIVGAESTGKTWLCETLAGHYKTVWVPEFAREYCKDKDLAQLTLDDLTFMCKQQILQEDVLINAARRFLFCDTSPITLKIWAQLTFKEVPDLINDMAAKTSYDHYFITNNEIEWQEDVLRQNLHAREMILQYNISEVSKTNKPYTIIAGRGDERLGNALKIIEQLHPKFLEE
jgi:nicotinamide riboside kinase